MNGYVIRASCVDEDLYRNFSMEQIVMLASRSRLMLFDSEAFIFGVVGPALVQEPVANPELNHSGLGKRLVRR